MELTLLISPAYAATRGHADAVVRACHHRSVFPIPSRTAQTSAAKFTFIDIYFQPDYFYDAMAAAATGRWTDRLIV